MSLSVKANDVELDEYLMVTDLRRGVGPTRTNILQKLGRSNGEKYLGYTKDTKIYEMDFVLRYDLIAKRRALAGLLDVNEPTKVVFGDEPGKYVLAVPDGDINVDEKSFLGFGTIVWLIPDGVSYSVDEKKFIASTSADGVLEVEVNNGGTEECIVDIQADFVSDNGLFAVVTEDAVIEVGSSTEVDGHTYEQSDEVAKNALTPEDKSNWIENHPNAQTVYPITPDGILNKIGQGSWSWTGEAPTPSYPSNNEACWIGPTLSRDVPPNSNGENTGNFDAIWRGTFSTKTVKEVGREEFNLVNGDQIVCAFVIRDSSYSKQALTCDYYIYVNGERDTVHTFDVDLKKAQGSWFEIRITRIGASITFKFSTLKSIKNEEANKVYFTHTKTFTKDEYAGIPITDTHFWPHAKWLNRPTARLGMSNFIFRWINVDKWSDDPNRYTKGDVMTINSSEGKVYLNGTPIMNDVVKGSKWIKVPPGRSLIQFAFSDFATAPIVTATIREVYL